MAVVYGRVDYLAVDSRELVRGGRAKAPQRHGVTGCLTNTPYPPCHGAQRGGVSGCSALAATPPLFASAWSRVGEARTRPHETGPKSLTPTAVE